MIVFVVGRQRVGKTVFLNVLAQYAREHGADFEIWDADISNASNNLSALHPEAKSPPSRDPDQAKAWLERQINQLMEDPVDAMVDVGGGETALTRVIAELPLADSLEEQGIRVVVVHMVGPDAADLDYLDSFEDGGLFAAPATLVVQNAGLVMTARDRRGFRLDLRPQDGWARAGARRDRGANAAADLHERGDEATTWLRRSLRRQERRGRDGGGVS